MKRLMWLSWPALCLPLLLAPALAAGGAGGTAPNSAGTAQVAEPSVKEPPAAVPSVEEPSAEEEDPIDQQAMDILMRMADTLAEAKGFSVTIRTNYDAVQESGEKIEFAEHRTVTLKRPDGLRVELQQSDGKKALVTFDGKMITMFNPDQNVYGQVEKAGSVDDALRYLTQDLQVRLPLALLLVTTLPAELDQRLEALDYVERDALTPVPTDHLSGRTEAVDFQVWIAAEGTPLPRRITITYKNDEGEPQFRADFADWVLDPQTSGAQLAFTPPPGAERIPFLIRVPRTPTGQPPAEETTQAPAQAPAQTPGQAPAQPPTATTPPAVSGSQAGGNEGGTK